VEAVVLLNEQGALSQPAELLQLVTMATAAGQRQPSSDPLTAMAMFDVAQTALAALAAHHNGEGCGRAPFKLASARCVAEAKALNWEDAIQSATLATQLLHGCSECTDKDGLDLSRIATDLGVSAAELG
jgi:hypothetical protein